MPLNAVRFAAKYTAFGAKYTAFCTKTQGEMLLNAVRFAANCQTKSINIHSKCINKTSSNHDPQA